VRKKHPEKFLLELIKPSHYDDDGYVIQWWRGFIPSNSLASVYGLALDAAARGVLGEGVEIEIRAQDETTTVCSTGALIRRFRRNGNRGLVCMIGVQTNQYPRALDIARPLRAAGIKVAIGRFHVSGLMAMLPELTPDLREAIELGITLFAGEAEGRLGNILRAADEERLEPTYNFTAEQPHLEGQPLPYLPERHIRRYAGTIASFDAGRGCPFSCSFCTIINVQGRKSRYRSADDVEQILREHRAQGIRSFFITDDNFARNRNWEAILDRIIELKHKENFQVHIAMQVDTMCHKIPRFVEKAARAGCNKVFIGLENINPGSLRGASKGQNQITEYRAMLQAWRKAKVLSYAGYILGFPEDTPESIERDIRIIQRELPVDIMEFFILSPAPGSKDHQQMYLRGDWMAPDLNIYDTEHPAMLHPRMTQKQWKSIYERAWHLYYSPQHIETLIRRAKASGIGTSRIVEMVTAYYGMQAFEHVHPLQGGLLRRKKRCQRRTTFKRENPAAFFIRRVRDVLGSYPAVLLFIWKLKRLRNLIERDTSTYTDIALTPVHDEYGAGLELFNVTESARHAADVAVARATRARSPLRQR
jgi:radical SAM superfamily enzyme YgiQ (UPF0313 family)